MSRQKISDTKIKAIAKMKELGFSVTKIAEKLEISRLTVNDHLNPDSYNERLRRTKEYQRKNIHTTIVLGGKRIPLTDLRVKPRAGMCELCGADNTKLCYHIWDGDSPSIGVWVCADCRRITELVDRKGGPEISNVVSRYYLLKSRITREIAKVSEN